MARWKKKLRDVSDGYRPKERLGRCLDAFSAWEMVREIPEEAGTVSDETPPHDARNHRPRK